MIQGKCNTVVISSAFLLVVLNITSTFASACSYNGPIDINNYVGVYNFKSHEENRISLSSDAHDLHLGRSCFFVMKYIAISSNKVLFAHDEKLHLYNVKGEHIKTFDYPENLSWVHDELFGVGNVELLIEIYNEDIYFVADDIQKLDMKKWEYKTIINSTMIEKNGDVLGLKISNGNIMLHQEDGVSIFELATNELLLENNEPFPGFERKLMGYNGSNETLWRTNFFSDVNTYRLYSDLNHSVQLEQLNKIDSVDMDYVDSKIIYWSEGKIFLYDISTDNTTIVKTNASGLSNIRMSGDWIIYTYREFFEINDPRQKIIVISIAISVVSITGILVAKLRKKYREEIM